MLIFLQQDEVSVGWVEAQRKPNKKHWVMALPNPSEHF